MARIVKSPDIRKSEIVSASLSLFCRKGYNSTAVSDIVKKIGVAQGTFYYHFKSKEEVIDSIIESYVDYIIEIIKPIIADKNMSAIKKIELILFKEFTLPDDDKVLEKIIELHFIPDLDIHQKMLRSKVVKYSPLVTKIIKNGVSEGVFKTKFPLESVEVLLAAYHFLFDPCVLPFDEKDYKRRALASTHIIENILIAKKGSFSFFPKLILENIRRMHENKKIKFKK